MIPDRFRETFLQAINREAPESINWTIEAGVKAFIEKEFRNETPQTLLLFERKARSLYNSSVISLLEKEYTIVGLRKFEHAIWTKTGALPKNVSILTDCINSGNEVGKIVKHFSPLLKIDAIYAFIANRSGLKKLAKFKETKNIPLHIGHELRGKKLQRFFRMLQVYYQSQIEPLDVDHPYDIYQVSASLTKFGAKEIVEKCCQKALGIECLKFEKDESLFVPENIENMSLDIGDINKIKNPDLLKKLQPLIHIKFEFPQIRLKTKFVSFGTNFALMACFPPVDLRFSCLHKKNCYVNSQTSCYIDLVRSNLALSRKKLLLCALCIENYVSRIILGEIEKYFLNFLPKVVEKSVVPKNNLMSVQKYDPIQRSYHL